MQQWLEEKRQPTRAIDRFWRQVLVSAINEDLDRMAASHGFQVFRLGFLARSDSYEMGVPAVPLGRLYRDEAWEAWAMSRSWSARRSKNCTSKTEKCVRRIGRRTTGRFLHQRRSV